MNNKLLKDHTQNLIEEIRLRSEIIINCIDLCMKKIKTNQFGKEEAKISLKTINNLTKANNFNTIVINNIKNNSIIITKIENHINLGIKSREKNIKNIFELFNKDPSFNFNDEHQKIMKDIIMNKVDILMEIIYDLNKNIYSNNEHIKEDIKTGSDYYFKVIIFKINKDLICLSELMKRYNNEWINWKNTYIQYLQDDIIAKKETTSYNTFVYDGIEKLIDYIKNVPIK